MDGESAPTGLIVDLAARIYGCHAHAGRVYISVAQALNIAATIVGAAQSAILLEVVERAKASPAAALDNFTKSQTTMAEAINADRKRQMADLVSALQTGSKD